MVPVTNYGPHDVVPWQGIPEGGWLSELLAPLNGVELGIYDLRILEWSAFTLDWPTLRVLTSLLHRARAAEPLAPSGEQSDHDAQTSRVDKPSEHEGDYEASVEDQ